jgi:predicted dehydrogenase
MSNRPLNVGLVGGGKGAFIVNPHQKAIHFDGTRRVTAGALFPDPRIALEEAANWPYPIKGYGSYDEMISAQRTLPASEKLDYILIVTPNFVHFDPAMKALDAGIPVFCEKPLTVKLDEAEKLVKQVRAKNIPFGVAHTYLGHWTSRFSRYIVRAGLLGDVRWVDSYYLQGWLATKLEDTGQQQAAWRVDPKKAGGSGCGGDIGTHALMQLRYVTGLEVAEVSANLEIFVKGRPIDDHFTAYCRLSNGARALVRASQISIGHLNDLGLEVCGTKGTLRWRQEDPEVVTSLLSRRGHAWGRVHSQGHSGGSYGRAHDSAGASGGVSRRVRPPASMFRSRCPQVPGSSAFPLRWRKIRQCGGWLDRNGILALMPRVERP